MTITGIISAILIGVVVGVLGRLLVPGKQRIGMLLTILVGIVAAFLGTALARAMGIPTATNGVDWLELLVQGVVGDDVELQVVSGNGWDQALDDADWIDGEVLALGTSPRGEIARVFLGSRGTKIMRYSPVPVLVLPG